LPRSIRFPNKRRRRENSALCHRDTKVYVDVVIKDETFWMTQKAIAELSDVNVPAISWIPRQLQKGGTVQTMRNFTKYVARAVKIHSCVF
jgi:hypothetical protein